ncbi:MAG: DoxX family membrane protein [Desulfarculaceae bacterium]|nr:DoxX family membrane protein [Desulfarculaceae bacterium]MCF8047930.1 DoxX family membrane protein [Desulfarculaceae bacterium]MCF8066209.1 DoxX family membrane protein [Desulfarculaceae bacterium]MCF8099124.1 DoxX family membrane protein [Desulfarculaceae bacterium]MCF8124277.1 DoxX family membrane protein [Desulfarculaceae bacterium]
MPFSANAQKWIFFPWLYRLARWALGVVFIYAGTAKLMDPGAFATVISRYGMAPDFLVPVAALGLPALEVLAGVGLLLDLKGSLSAIFAMLIMFAVVLWFGALNGLDIDCGCFSTSELAEHDSLRQALYRDLIMLATALYLYLWRWSRREARESAGWRYVYQSNSREVRT